MPIYEYECKQCGHRFERKQSVNDDPLKVCPVCQGNLRKLLFPVGIVFKGSGFYKTDYASTSSSSDNGNGRHPGSKDDGGASSATGATKDNAEKAGKTEAGKAESGKTETGKDKPAAA